MPNIIKAKNAKIQEQSSVETDNDGNYIKKIILILTPEKNGLESFDKEKNDIIIDINSKNKKWHLTNVVIESFFDDKVKLSGYSILQNKHSNEPINYITCFALINQIINIITHHMGVFFQAFY